MTINRKIISESIQYIANQQQKDGGFISFSSSKQDDFADSFSYRTNFITAIILETLSNVPYTPLLYQIKNKAVDYLLEQKSKRWSWNYWSKSSKEFITKPYPDDLDDTFCALNAIYLFDKGLITGSAYAYIIQLLTAAEEKEGGPYKTWLISQNTSGWDDIDIVVNSNIAFFLHMQETNLPNLQLFFEKRLQKKDIQSPYYPSVYPFFYFLSRFYDDKKNIENILLANRNNMGYWENPLNTSLAVLALLNGNFPAKKIENSIAYLLEKQNENQWQAYAFCIDPAENGMKYYAGSSALTTAFCLTAISLFINRTQEMKLHKTNNDQKINSYIEEIVNTKLLKFKSKEFTEMGNAVLGEIMVKDTAKQIPLMPYYFSQSLGKNGKVIQKKDIIMLGQANVLGWLAYTIYDDFLDDEGNPNLLPLANIYLRRLIKIFDTAFVKNKAIASFFHTMLDTIEYANEWEVTNCRLKLANKMINIEELKIPDFDNLEQLANKSLGHGLGPLTILLLLGYKQTSKEFISLYHFFTHYLIAKQLHDDAHDWEEDLSKGHITFAVALILKKAREKKIITTKKIEIKKIIPKLQKLFWYEIIEEICSYIYDHVKNAQKELESFSIILDKNILENLLLVYKDSADKALEERKKTIDFLQTY